MPKPKKRPCPHGKARQQVLDAVKLFGPCSYAILRDYFKDKMAPVTLSRWLLEFQKLGSVVQVRKGVYAMKAHTKQLHRLQVIAATQPAKLEVLKTLCKKGRPMSPTELAGECYEKHGKRLGLEESSFYRMVSELRKARIVNRKPGYADGKHVLLDPQWAEDLYALGYLKKSRPPTPAPLDPDLADLLS